MLKHMSNTQTMTSMTQTIQIISLVGQKHMKEPSLQLQHMQCVIMNPACMCGHATHNPCVSILYSHRYLSAHV